MSSLGLIIIVHIVMNNFQNLFRYKRQMDEMQKAFDQTQNRLKEMSQLVEDNHRNHDEVLSRRKEEVDELTDKVSMK